MNLAIPSIGPVRPQVLVAGLEAALVVALAAQAARLTWAVVTPAGPLGETAPAMAPARPKADLAILSQFDPFFRVPAAAGGEAASALSLIHI